MGYYSEHLGGDRLRACYEAAPARVRQYLRAEISHVIERLESRSSVLELGCGYGRVTLELAKVAARVVGIDTSIESLILGRRLARSASVSNCEFLEMDALALNFPDDEFDAAICVQNGICAFGVDQLSLLREALRVTRPGGRVILSSYAERFWAHRLDWFHRQAKMGLIGDIDLGATGGGVIVCKDGFRAGAMGQADFRALCSLVGIEPLITEVDGSSVFCELVVPGGG